MLTEAIAVQVNKTSESFAKTMKLLKPTHCKALFCDPGSDEKYIKDMETFLNSEESAQFKPIVILLKKSARSSLLPMAYLKLTPKEDEMSLQRLQPESTAFIFTTSGSTGTPKMVEMTHLAIVNASYSAYVGTGGTCYNDRPFSWSGGTPIFSILNGNKRVFVDTAIGMNKENIMMIWDIITAERCTHAFLLPYALFDLISNLEVVLKTSNLMYAIATGGQHISSHLTEVCGKCTQKLFMDFASTECGSISSIELTREMEEGHVGSLFPGYEVKIVGDNGDTLKRGKYGDILVRYPWILKSYRNAPQMNAVSFADGGWFRTRDIGHITVDGKLFVEGKSGDLIKRGGVKVLPSVVEGGMSKILGVREVVVVPIPNKRLLEEVCACYILEEDVNISADD